MEETTEIKVPADLSGAKEKADVIINIDKQEAIDIGVGLNNQEVADISVDLNNIQEIQEQNREEFEKPDKDPNKMKFHWGMLLCVAGTVIPGMNIILSTAQLTSIMTLLPKKIDLVSPAKSNRRSRMADKDANLKGIFNKDNLRTEQNANLKGVFNEKNLKAEQKNANVKAIFKGETEANNKFEMVGKAGVFSQDITKGDKSINICKNITSIAVNREQQNDLLMENINSVAVTKNNDNNIIELIDDKGVVAINVIAEKLKDEKTLLELKGTIMSVDLNGQANDLAKKLINEEDLEDSLEIIQRSSETFSELTGNKELKDKFAETINLKEIHSVQIAPQQSKEAKGLNALKGIENNSNSGNDAISIINEKQSVTSVNMVRG